MAAYKGMILCNSAGNEGFSNWEKIIFPADAKNILTVGAIAGDSSLAYFSSVGYTSDGRIKPDIMAMGLDVAVIGAYGKEKSNGTSFSCPIISGLTASLWQALPRFNSLELMDLIRKSADRYQNPDNEYGYGIPDYFKAYTEGLFDPLIPSKFVSDHLVFDSKENRIYVRGDNDSQTRLSIYTSIGVKVLDTHMASNYLDVSYLNKGIYIVCFQNGNKQYTGKFVIQ
jgi:hypothetical protein